MSGNAHYFRVASAVSIGPSCVHTWIISDGQISVCMVVAMSLMVLDRAALQVHGAMALCDKECMVAWSSPVLLSLLPAGE